LATIAVHGGAGGGGEPQVEGVNAALDAALGSFASGGDALDAACAAVVALEADGRFNAGRGAVRTHDGSVELDTAVMRGSDRRCGSLGALTRVKHPVLAARALLDAGGPVFLVGEHADAFALARDDQAAPDDWFTRAATASPAGTVGAVAVDDNGVYAAATSTGGVHGQANGRIGDSPVIGAGTYADERCAISATGDGEVFLRAVFAHSVAAAVGHGAQLRDACAAALADVASLGGTGGCVAVTEGGVVVLDHNTPRMPAGWATTDGARHVQLAHN
jgi:beta-aspartyl-peptidase (threonine type)